MPSLLFEVVQESDGGYCAECLTENVFTEGDTREELRKNAIEATAAFFFDRRGLSESAFTLSATRFCPWHEDPSRRRWRYTKVHQERISIPGDDPLRHGTFGSILRKVAQHKGAIHILSQNLKSGKNCGQVSNLDAPDEPAWSSE